MPIRFRDFLRFGVFGVAVALIVAFGISPFTGGIVQQWSRSDVEARSRLVFNAIQPFLDRDVADQSWDRLSEFIQLRSMKMAKMMVPTVSTSTTPASEASR